MFAVPGRIWRDDFVEQFGNGNRKLLLFGAGHVGRALVLALAPLPFDVTWIDPRDGAFPSVAPANVTPVQSAHPAAELAAAPLDSFVLVMTHDHGLDLEIVAAALGNPHVAFTGLIGSATKRARFAKRLREAGLADEKIGAMACPIGNTRIKSKHPAAIAAATAVQLLEQDELLRTAVFPVATPVVFAKVGRGRGAT
jgi:xanthine dehydrogenase accessory factor